MTTFGVVAVVFRSAALSAEKYCRRIDRHSHRCLIDSTEQIILLWRRGVVKERAVSKAEEGDTPDINLRLFCKDTRQ